MALIAAVAPSLSPLPPPDLVRDHTALSVPPPSADRASTVLIPCAPAVSNFGLFIQVQWDLCVLVHQMYQPHL